MSTNATISILLADDSVSTIYSHWDGYPQGVGTVLLESYNTEAQVQDLIAQGDVSSLDHTLTGSDFYRNRGDTDVDARNYELDDIEDMQEYNYLWARDEWLVAVNGAWFKLAYYLAAEIEVIDHYLVDKDSELA